MDCQAPRDASLRNIIDKLAEFVARNGPEFEAITKQKQQGNPKFDFLYGGEFANYYQYRVATEQAFLKQGLHQQLPPGIMHMQQQQTLPHFTQAPPPLLQQQQPPLQQSQQQHQQPPPLQQQHQMLPIVHDQHAQQFSINQAKSAPQQQQQPHGIWPNVQVANTQQQHPQQKPPQQQNGNNNTALTASLTSQIEAINMQQSTLRDQIHQSEANLSAQHTAMMTQQTKQIDDAITAAQNTQLEELAEEQSIALRDYDAVLQPIIESCTKDSISAGKNWILQHSTDSAKNNVVLQYLLKKALVNGSTFQQKLHLIYLVNDILHHCMRKNVNELKNSLENVVIPMFCSADLIATSEQRTKLAKLLSLWESKAKFFDACVISKLQSPDSSMLEYKTNLQNTHHEIVAKFAQGTKATLDNYQKQHQVFAQHATQQIAQLEKQKLQLEQQMLTTVIPQNTQPSPQQQQQPQQQQPTQSSPTVTPIKQIPSLMSQKISMPGTDPAIEHLKPPGVDDTSANASGNNPPMYQPHVPSNVFSGNPFQSQQQQPPQQQSPQQNFFIPDMSKPPPGFGGLTGAGQMPQMLQQQQPQPQQPYPQMVNNIPPVMENVNCGSNTTTVDMIALNAAIQLVHHQQQQQQQHHHHHQQHQQHQQQQHHHHQQQQQFQHQQQMQQHLHHQQQQQQPQTHTPTLEEEELHLDDAPLPPVPTMSEEEQIPTAPYYDLPAGLMVPLIRLEDYNYRPLEPTDIRLPAPTPQNERLTNALNAFYAPPSHDRPRDNEGWEKLGLYEYYKVKNAAKKQKEEELKNGEREKSRSPSPILVEKPKPKKLNKRYYRSKSRSRSPIRSPYQSRSRSRSRSRGRSENTMPTNRNNSSNSGNRNRQRNRSPRHDRDAGSNATSGGNNNNSGSSNSGNNNRENRADRNSNNLRRVERDRSPTPPSFFGNSFAKTNAFIEESNKGHQMLMKMGWAGTGTGLGSKNQGIEQPISAGEVRDRKDLYKGVGNNLNDPFESFRKNKGAAFVHRMRTRDDNKS